MMILRSEKVKKGGPDMKYKDYYSILGVEKTASADQIKKAYIKDGTGHTYKSSRVAETVKRAFDS